MKRLVSLYEGYQSDKILLEKDITWHGISFYLKDDRWYCLLDDDLTLADGRRAFALDDGRYEMVRKDRFFTIYLFVQRPSSFKAFQRCNFLLSDIIQADIVYDVINNYHIFLKGDHLYSDIDLIYLNGKRYQGQSLKDHDVIDFLGIRIIVTERVVLISDSYTSIKLSPFKEIYAPYKETYKLVAKKYHPKYELPKLRYKVKLKPLAQNTEAPFLVSFGQGLFMSLGMLVVAVINGYISYQNDRAMIEIVLMVMMPLLMAIGAILFPFIQRRYRQSSAHKRSIDQTKANQKALDDLKSQIEADIMTIREYHDHYRFDSDKYLSLLKDDDIYQRDKNDDDMLYIALGIGKIKLDLKIDTERDEDRSYLKDIYKAYKMIDGTFILDLKKIRYITFLVAKKKREDLFLYVLLQIVLLTSPRDLKIVISVDDDFIKRHPELKDIKHLWTNDHRLLFDHEAKDIDIDQRVVVLSFYKGEEIIKENISYLYFSDDPIIPKRSDLIIRYQGDDIYVKDGEKEDHYHALVFRYDPHIFYRLRLYHELDEEDKKSVITLDDIYPLDLDLDKSYSTKRKGIEVTLGLDQNGHRLSYDVSQTGIGPHCLIGGATGSGKSELVLAMIMSLVLNYSASDLSLALIDFKGTGLKEALSYRGELLPHIDLALSNLDEVALDRSLAYFKLECKRREEVFQKLASITHTSIMDLKDYDRADPLRYGLSKIPYLFIVIDEFAELKASRQNFMQDIISIARIGRSLGIMMILITQKPAAVVDKEVWANTAYRIALKVNDVADSKELLNNDLAFKIKRPGEFYLLADKLSHGRCAYTRSLVDERNYEEVTIIDLKGKTLKTKEFIVQNEERQLSYFIKKIIDHHKERHIKLSSIYKKALKEESFMTLYKRYDVKLDLDKVLLGEDDDFNKMTQNALIHDLKIDPFVIFSYKTQEVKEAFYKLFCTSLALKADHYHFVMISDKKVGLGVYDGLIEKVHYEDGDDIAYIFAKIKKGIKKKAIIFIDDYMRFSQNEDRKMILEKEIFQVDSKDIAIIIATNTKISLSFRLDQIFKKYVLEYENKEELIYAFNKAQAVSEPNVYMRHDDLIGFKLCKVPNIDQRLKRSSDLIDHLPKKITSEDGLIGYDIKRRTKVYAPKGKILFVAYYKELLDRFKKVYKGDGDHSYHVLQDVPKDIYHDAICWIGPNIVSQYLFIPKIKRDLKADEAYIEIGNEVHIIRYVDA